MSIIATPFHFISAEQAAGRRALRYINHELDTDVEGPKNVLANAKRLHDEFVRERRLRKNVMDPFMVKTNAGSTYDREVQLLESALAAFRVVLERFPNYEALAIDWHGFLPELESFVQAAKRFFDFDEIALAALSAEMCEDTSRELLAALKKRAEEIRREDEREAELAAAASQDMRALRKKQRETARAALRQANEEAAKPVIPKKKKKKGAEDEDDAVEVAEALAAATLAEVAKARQARQERRAARRVQAQAAQ